MSASNNHSRSAFDVRVAVQTGSRTIYGSPGELADPM
jgi:hypothetical protein